jgi:hypothetical protein
MSKRNENFSSAFKVIGLLAILVLLILTFFAINVYRNVKDVRSIDTEKCRSDNEGESFKCFYEDLKSCEHMSIGPGYIIIGSRGKNCNILMSEQLTKDPNPDEDFIDGLMESKKYKCLIPLFRGNELPKTPSEDNFKSYFAHAKLGECSEVTIFDILTRRVLV